MKVRTMRAGLSLLLLVAIACGADPAAAQPQRSASADVLLERSKGKMITDPAAAQRDAQTVERLAMHMPVGRDAYILRSNALWLQSEALIRQGKTADATPLIDKALKAIADVKEPIKLRGDLLMSRAGVQAQRGEVAQALAGLQLAFQIFGQVKEPRSQSLVLQNIAHLYKDAGDLDRASKYLKQSSDLYQSDQNLLLFLHNSRGTVLLKMDRVDEAIAQFRAALDIADKIDGSAISLTIIRNLSRALITAGRLDEAERSIAQGMARARAGKDAEAEKQMLSCAADIALLRGNLDRAGRLITRSLQGIDPTKSTLAYRDIHIAAYNIYRAQRADELALPHLEAIRRLDEEVTKVATSTSAALMAARFDYANQELRIANLKAEELRRSVELQRSRVRFQRILFGTLGTAAMVVVGLLAFNIAALRRSASKVRAANLDLAATNTALGKALKAKTEFLATTSHEIRTPLNGILGMTQVMLSDAKLAAETRDRISVVHGAGVTMRALVDDILDVAKMETGNLTVELAPLDLPATLREVTRMWEEQARAKGLAFTLDVEEAPDWIESDPGRLRQIVFNLLSNAIKFTKAGEVTLCARAVQAGELRRLRLSVSDTGIGIPDDKRDEIFESFRQVDAGTTRKYGGTGLGLAICRNLADALGGAITVDSEIGQGSTFMVDLPLIAVEAPDLPAAAMGEGTLLVLDRNPIARAMLKTLFEPHVGQIVFAATPGEATTMLASGGVSLLLVDEATLKAGEGDPLVELHDLATLASQNGTATVGLWVRPDEGVRAAVLATGVDQLIAKPISGTALVDSLLGHLQSKTPTPSANQLVSQAA